MAVENEARLEQLYKELGQAYYEGGFEDPLPQLLAYFDQITQLRNEMHQNMISDGKPTVCPRCGGQLEEDAVFCGNCGYKVGGRG